MRKIFTDYLNRISEFLPLNLTIVHSDGKKQNLGSGGPKVDLQIHNSDIYWQLALNPSLAFGEGYANGEITIPSNNLFDFFKGYGSIAKQPKPARILEISKDFLGKFSRGNTIGRSQKNVQEHYDKFHRIVSLIVDPDTNLYSCALYNSPKTTLAKAQQEKTFRTLQKLNLQKGQNILEIGCGYGYIARRAARDYGVNLTALTLSQEQHKVASQLAAAENLPVKILLSDYRHITESFDGIYSVAMYEAVGRKHWDDFFQHIVRLLKPGGIFLLHTVTQKKWEIMDSFIDTHVFPGSQLPTPRQVLHSAEKSGLRFHHSESWKPHYSRTLQNWYSNLQARRNEILNGLYKDPKEALWYYRLWEVYLAGCAASFATEEGMDLHQFIFSHGNKDWNITDLDI